MGLRVYSTIENEEGEGFLWSNIGKAPIFSLRKSSGVFISLGFKFAGLINYQKQINHQECKDKFKLNESTIYFFMSYIFTACLHLIIRI